MIRPPICIKHLPDEVWYSYECRLAMVNGFRSVKAFEDHYLTSPGRAGMPAGTARQCTIWKSIRSLPNINDMTDMTTLYYDMLGMYEGTQAKMLEHLMADTSDNTRPTAVFRSYGGTVMIKACPICLNTDKAVYGFAYLHTCHQSKSVHACVRHYVPLLYRKMPGRGSPLKSIEDIFADSSSYRPPNIKKSVQLAEDLQIKAWKMKSILQLITCPRCHAEYFAHPYSIRTGYVCPVCHNGLSDTAIIQTRLDSRYPGSYKLLKYKNIHDAVITHVPCRITFEGDIVQKLVYTPNTGCKWCKNGLVGQLRRMPEYRDFMIFVQTSEEIKNNIVRVRHKPCGQDMYIDPYAGKKTLSCPYCSAKETWIPLSKKQTLSRSRQSVQQRNKASQEEKDVYTDCNEN